MESVGKDYIAGVQMLASFGKDLRRAKAHTARYFDIMADLAGGEDVAEVWTHIQATEDRFKAVVLGRFFEIITHPLSHDDEGKIACIVLIRNAVTNEPIELYRFMITRAGEAQTEKREELISHRSEAGPEMLLVQISLAVLHSRPS
ncbi:MULTISPECIES: hypothetical protein [Pseudomonas]|uniref:Uncharacterized protein n=1 Tax=Pseudomonas oryzihabitans TaxID=47885 RepID=A0A178L8S4_9PSED|nr:MULTISPECIES: hypothetical protein [Pseudomonas]MDC7828051.1 hypothetical protein [Pseudomonas benzopyrenica]NRH41528.1 hypothetical protein [Pseudomonas sp. MS15a(2019)]OAN26148.1 hypothetical protein A4V15_07060 [Pseudomonas oryzihabitans]